jgi:hypothetical protein
MGRSRKELHYGSRDGNGGVIRKAVNDRSSKAARPWNDPEVVDASERYGKPFSSFKGVVSHENALEGLGSLNESERMTCNFCGRFKSHPDHEGHF